MRYKTTQRREGNEVVRTTYARADSSTQSAFYNGRLVEDPSTDEEVLDHPEDLEFAFLTDWEPINREVVGRIE